MIWPGMDILAQTVVERVANSLAEGILIAAGAWLLLRFMGRHNPGTRFAVWMIALVGVLALPFLNASGSHIASFHSHSEFILPSSWALTFLIVWVGVAAAALSRVIAGLWQIGQIRRSCTEIDPSTLDPQLRQVIEQSDRPVSLQVSENVHVPAAIGFTKPVIVLPAWTLREFTSAELQPILIHELAHLRRFDGWTNLFQKVARALFFFHPAVWWIDARLSREREMACDDAVLATTGNAHAYAGTLISLLEKNCGRRGWTMAQAAVARAREASQRIARILRSGGSTTTRVAAPVLGMAAALSMLCGGLVLRAPRLLVFTPDKPSSIAHVESRTLLDNQIAFSGAGVVPAAFHPAQKPVLLHKVEITHSTAPLRHAVRSVSLHKAHSTATPPVVMVSLMTDGVAIQPDTAPMFLVVDASPSQNHEQPASQIQATRVVEEVSPGFHIEFVRILISTPTSNRSQSGLTSQI